MKIILLIKNNNENFVSFYKTLETFHLLNNDYIITSQKQSDIAYIPENYPILENCENRIYKHIKDHIFKINDVFVVSTDIKTYDQLL